MFNYRITKYNPIYRNERGAFLNDDWISFSDIGRDFDAGILTSDQYKKIEDMYIEAILSFMKCMNLKNLMILNIEKLAKPQEDSFYSQQIVHLYNSIANNQILDKSQIILAAQLTLRDNMWCRFQAPGMFVHFGYDYYMYIGSKKACPNTIFQIEQSGLFVEEFDSPYLDQPEEQNDEYIH